MNGKTGGPRRATALIAGAAVAALATACGSAPSVSVAASAGPSYAQLVALAQCMRSHGAPEFPDPSASGTFNDVNGTLDLGSSQVERAYRACRHLLPGGGPDLSRLQQQIRQRQEQALPRLLRFSRCMRGHGVPDFPDPTPSGLDFKQAGLAPASAQFQAAVRVCQRVLPGGMRITMQTHQSAGSR